MTYVPSRQINGIDPVSWAIACRKMNGVPFDHRNAPYQLEPLMESALAMEDRGLTLTFMKGRQIGITQTAISLALWHLDQKGGTVIHAVPSQANSKKLNSKVLIPALAQTKFKNLTGKGEIWNATEKHFVGNGMIGSYMIGHTLGGNLTAPGDAFRGMTAEIAIYDERNTMPPDAIAVIKSTLNVCPSPVTWNIGSAGDRGGALDKIFLAGSQAEWSMRCDYCYKHTVFMPYGSGVDELERCINQIDDDWHYVCCHCKKKLDTAKGKWVHSQAKDRSYHLSSLIAPWYSAWKLHDDLTDPTQTEESLMREVAGLSYGGFGVTIEPSDIKFEKAPRGGKVIMAVDWGSRSSWLSLTMKEKKIYVSRTGTVDGKHDEHVPQLIKVIKDIQPDHIAADFGAEGGRNEKLNDFASNVWSIHSGRIPTGLTGLLDNVRLDRRNRSYHVVKSWVWERLVSDLRRGKIVLAPGLEQLKHDILNVRSEPAGKKDRQYISYDTTDEHLAACLLMAYCVALREEKKLGLSVGTGGLLV